MISPFKIPCSFSSFSKTIPCSTFSVLSFPSPLHLRSPTAITMLHTHHRNLFISTATVAVADEDWGDGHGDRRKVSRVILYLLSNEGRPPNFVAGKLKMVLQMTIKDGRKALKKARYNKSKKHPLLETNSVSAKKFQAMLMEGDLLVDTEVEEIGHM